jgi:hypothetical protein
MRKQPWRAACAISLLVFLMASTAPVRADAQEAGPIDLSVFDGYEQWPLIVPADTNIAERIGLQRSFFVFELAPPNADPYETDLVLDVFPTHYAGRAAYIIQWTTSGEADGGAGAVDAVWVDAETFQARFRVAQNGPPSTDGGAGLYSVWRHDPDRALRVHIPPEGEVETFERNEASPSFDFATMGYLFGLMNLEEGQTFRLANVGRPPSLEPLGVPVRVGGIVEIVDEDGVAHPAREVTLGGADLGSVITFWVTDEAPYFLGWRFVLSGNGHVLNTARFLRHAG